MQFLFLIVGFLEKSKVGKKWAESCLCQHCSMENAKLCFGSLSHLWDRFFCLFSVILMGSCGNVMVSDSGRPNFFSLGLLWALWCVLLVGL